MDGMGQGMMELTWFKNKKVLITGHTGFKGTWLCRILAEAGAQVTGYALKPPTEPNLFTICGVADQIHSITGDVRNLSHLQMVFREAQPEIVIHLAAQPLVRESYRNPVDTYETNVMGTVNICECVRQNPCVKSFLNVTTDKVYENKEWEWGYRENEKLDGYDPYSNSKSCSELVTHSYTNSFFRHMDVAVSTARAGNVIGGGDFASDRIVPDCIRAAEQGKSIGVRNPYSIRPFQHVLDPLFAYLMILQRQYEDRTYAGCYNVGPDESNCVTTGHLTETFCDLWNQKADEFHLNPVRWENQQEEGPHEANYLKLDCSKLKNVFGWHPVWNFDTAMKNTVEWYQTYLAGGDIGTCMERQIQRFMKSI